MRIVLASASPRRKELLAQIGLAYEVSPSAVEEKITETLPEKVVLELSSQKAEEVFGRLAGQGETAFRERFQEGYGEELHENGGEEFSEGFLVIGADTVVALDGAVMGKPADEADACRMLGKLQGRTHQVYTGVSLCGKRKDGQVFRSSFYEKTDVVMYPMTGEEIEAYVATKEPMDKAGAYGIQGRCAAFIERINGDYNNVVGLPTGRLYQELKKYRIWDEQTDREPGDE